MAITLLRKLDRSDKGLSSINSDNELIPLGQSHCLAATGRSLLTHLIKTLNWNEKNTILLPAYLAEGIINPFLSAKINIKFYRLQNNLFPDLNDIQAHINHDSSIHGCVMIHPLGFEAPIAELKKILQHKNVFLIEDCAQGIYSSYKSGGFYGTKGDFALYSLNKFLPVSDGAILVSNVSAIDVSISKDKLLQPDDDALNHYMEHLYLNFDITKTDNYEETMAMMTQSSAAYDRYYVRINQDCFLRRCSEKSTEIRNNYDYPLLIKKRRENSHYLYSKLNNKNIQVLFEQYTDNIIPIAIPVIFPINKRKQWIDELQHHGIFLATLIDRWNFIPKDQQENFANESYYLKSHVLIPISEFLTDRHMEKLVMHLNLLQ